MPRRAVRRIYSNVGLLLGGKSIAGLMSLGYLIIVTRALGATGYGVLILLHGYVTLVGAVIAFSGWHGIVRYGTIAHQADDHGRMLRLIRFMALLELGFGVVAMVTAAALIPLVGPALHWPPEAMALALPYTFAIISTVRSTPDGILQIAGRFDLVSAHQLINPSIRLAGSLLALVMGGQLEAFVAVWLTASIAEGLGMWFLGLRQLRRMRLAAPLLGSSRGAVEENEGLLRFIVTTNVDITLGELGPKLAPLTVGWILGPAATGVYSLAQRASVILQQPTAMLAHASFAVIAKLLAAGEVGRFRRSVWHSCAIALSVAVPVTLLLSLFAEPIIRALGGRTFQGGAGLLILIAIGRALMAGSTSLSSGLIALGRPSHSIAANIIGNLVLYPLLPLLILLVGLNGAGWHALLQSLVIAGMLAWSFHRLVEERRRGLQAPSN